MFAKFDQENRSFEPIFFKLVHILTQTDKSTA